MGFMGYIFKILGFESDEQPTKIKKKKKAKASYRFKNGKSLNRAEHIDGIPVYYPENFVASKDYASFLKNKKAFIISVQYCDKDDAEKIVDYFQGLAYGLNAKFIVLEEDKLYLILPEGMEVEE